MAKSQLVAFVLDGKQDFEAVLKRLMTAAGVYKQADFSRILGISPTSITSARRRNKIPPEWIETISNKFDVPIESLISNEDVYENNGNEVVVRPDDFTYIPWVEAKLSAGGGSLIDSSKVIDMLAFKRDWVRHKGKEKNLALMEVMGDSMYPVLYDGDLVLIDLSKTDVREGKIFAVAYDGAIYVKRLFTEPGRLILRSDNEIFKDIVIDWQDESVVDSVKVIGKVIWWCHDE